MTTCSEHPVYKEPEEKENWCRLEKPRAILCNKNSGVMTTQFFMI